MPGTNPLHYEAIDDLADTPNIVVDGAGNAATLIALSHWPKSGTPHALKADSSAEIVFKYLESPEFHVAADAITNNHFDQIVPAILVKLVDDFLTTRQQLQPEDKQKHTADDCAWQPDRTEFKKAKRLYFRSDLGYLG